MMLIGGCTDQQPEELKCLEFRFFFIIMKELKKVNSPRSIFASNYKKSTY